MKISKVINTYAPPIYDFLNNLESVSQKAHDWLNILWGKYFEVMQSGPNNFSPGGHDICEKLGILQKFIFGEVGF